jgi:carbon-monoxide dehydrogenase small subunit
MASARTVRITVNGELYEATVPVHRTLLEFIRRDARLLGTKRGCETGDCGACSVLLDGTLVVSCLVLAVEANGRQVLTVEGLAEGRALHPLQEAFVEHGAVQCGFCTPGMLMAAKALLDRTSDPTEEDIREALAGNLCRCTGYARILRAVQAAAAKLAAAMVAK